MIRVNPVGRRSRKTRLCAAAALFVLLFLCFPPVGAEKDGAKPHTTREPLVTQPPVPWPETPPRDGEGFLAQEGEFVHEDDEAGLWIYLSPTLQVEIRRQQDTRVPLVWFETDIRTRGGGAFPHRHDGSGASGKEKPLSL